MKRLLKLIRFCVIVYVSFSPSLILGSISVFHTIPDLYAVSLLFMLNYLNTIFLMWYCLRVAQIGWGGGVGFTWVEWGRNSPLSQNYASARFIVPTQGPMTGPISVPCPTWNWGVDLCGPYVNKIFQPGLRFGRLSSLARAKWVRPFFLPCFDSISQVRSELPSLPCHQHKEQTENFFSGCLDQGLPCLSFLIVYHISRTAAIAS